jgi:hypothetical protein
MNLFKSIFRKTTNKFQTYDDFWMWFRKNEKKFHSVVKSNGNFQQDFFEKLEPKLKELREGYFYLVGMFDETTVELIFTADGTIKNFVFVEELVESAPPIAGWKFTAHKPALDIKNVNINMGVHSFNGDNLKFATDVSSQYPDEINVLIVHPNFTHDSGNKIIAGVFIFLDNYLGELNFASAIDRVEMATRDEVKELIPIVKLKEYVAWRQKEFIEKYEGFRHNTDNDTYSSYEAKLESGNALVATINSDLLEWDAKASHPWMLIVHVKYDGSRKNGMPDDTTYRIMNEMEDEISSRLRDREGYLQIGRETGNGERTSWFGCNDFRKASRVANDITKEYSAHLTVSYDIYKDKYWKSVDRFKTLKNIANG